MLNMKVLAVNYSNSLIQNHNKQSSGLRLLPPLRYDTVCFRSRDFLDLPEEDILTKIQESIKPECFAGQGTEAEVYRIKDTGYCVRIPYVAHDIQNFNYTKKLTPIDKVNHIVAKLGFGAAVMKYFEGETPKDYKSNNIYRYNFQEKIAEMPLEAYSDLLHQIANALDNEMFFDFSGGNLIVDTKNNKLTAIDFFGVTDNPRPVNPLTEMYSVLTCYGSQEATGKKIFDNIIDAGLEEFKPDKIPCMDVELFDFNGLVLKRNSDNNSFGRGNINKYINPINKLIDTIYENIKDLKQLKKKEITDKSVSKLLEEKLINCRRLLRRIK